MGDKRNEKSKTTKDMSKKSQELIEKMKNKSEDNNSETTTNAKTENNDKEKPTNEKKQSYIETRKSIFDKIFNNNSTNNDNNDEKSKFSKVMEQPIIQMLIPGTIAYLIITYFMGIIYYFIYQLSNHKIRLTINPFKCWKIMFFTKSGLKMSGLFLMFTIIGMLILHLLAKKRKTNDERNFNFSERGDYGTASHMTQEEKDYLLEVSPNIEDMTGFIVGKDDNGNYVGIPANSKINRNFSVCGSQGTGKSQGYVKINVPQLIKMGQSVIFTDTKGELRRDTYKLFKDAGYIIKQWNLKDPLSSNGWHCLAEATGRDINTFVNTIIRNTTDEQGQSFYNDVDANLLKALFLYVKEYKTTKKEVRKKYEKMDKAGIAYNHATYQQELSQALIEDRRFEDAYSLLYMKRDNLNKLFENLDDKSRAKQTFNLFLAAEKVQGNSILSSGSRLALFQEKIIQTITGIDDIDLELPAKKKCAYFIIIPDQESTYDVLATLFITFLFIKLIKYADSRPNGKCDVPVHFMLDEFPNTGEIPDFKKKEATARGRDIGMTILFQNIPQMMDRYPNNQWLEILGGCDTQIFFGCNDETTAKYYSGKTGEATIDVGTERKTLKTIRMIDYAPEENISEGQGRRLVFTPDEITHLHTPTKEDPFGKAMLFVAGSRPLVLHKHFYWENPYFGDIPKGIGIELAEDYVPDWIYEMKEKTDFRSHNGPLYDICPKSDYTPRMKELMEKWEKEARKPTYVMPTKIGSAAIKEPDKDFGEDTTDDSKDIAQLIKGNKNSQIKTTHNSPKDKENDKNKTVSDSNNKNNPPANAQSTIRQPASELNLTPPQKETIPKKKPADNKNEEQLELEKTQEDFLAQFTKKRKK